MLSPSAEIAKRHLRIRSRKNIQTSLQLQNQENSQSNEFQLILPPIYTLFDRVINDIMVQ